MTGGGSSNLQIKVTAVAGRGLRGDIETMPTERDARRCALPALGPFQPIHPLNAGGPIAWGRFSAPVRGTSSGRRSDELSTCRSRLKSLKADPPL